MAPWTGDPCYRQRCINRVPSWITREARSVAEQCGYTADQVNTPCLVDMANLLPMLDAVRHGWMSCNEPFPRVLDLVLVFAGDSQAAVKANEKGMMCGTIDKLHGDDQDITSIVGMLYAVFLIVSLKVDALAWFSPECSTWLTFLSRGTYKRCSCGNNILGDLNLAKCTTANSASAACAFL
eukprot:9477781-Pyramimonas_sp.AAC.2